MSPTDWMFIPESDLVPYQPLQSWPAGGVMVFAPHPDDEVFGVGGTLALAAQRDLRVRVVVVSDGGIGGDAGERECESRAAAAVLGYDRDPDSLIFWGLPDRGVVPDQALIRRMRHALDEQRPEWLLLPSPYEVHPDHRAVCVAAIRAAAGAAVDLGFYEVGQPLMPSALVDISPVLVRKQAAMDCFGSQLAVQRYDQQVTALNRYRAYTLGPAVSHAEALWFPGRLAQADERALLALAQRRLAQRLGMPAG